MTVETTLNKIAGTREVMFGKLRRPCPRCGKNEVVHGDVYCQTCIMQSLNEPIRPKPVPNSY
jgi:hypothetical protein